MPSNDEPVQHCTLAEAADLRTALEAAAIEYLDVDEYRTIVIYQQAIFMVIATEGQAMAAWEFDVELWKEPPDNTTRDLDDLLAGFIDELVATTETTRR
ncbi:hypothetical protein [Natrinema pallidum]|uniref:Uncharacterized protein n=1 Tax=Natrinema pallidum DSM 3751 TaxID=1227495 RepID=L9YHC4_9EURY|nr:hypothetical protein [Natrinema pallidum]ELY73505.1 hypothetical protein C487_17150 [Natrinema pallidum DSM 3751]